MIDPGRLTEAADAAAEVYERLTDEQWGATVEPVRWTGHEVVVHVAEVLAGYAMSLAARLERPWPALRLAIDDHDDAVAALRSGAAVLADVARAAPPDARGFHAAGPADAEGFVAMGLDEVIVHTADVAIGSGLPYRPPDDLVVAVLDRLFPWWPRAEDPWAALLAANGRGAAADAASIAGDWLWHSRPVAEWDGRVPEWDPELRRPRAIAPVAAEPWLDPRVAVRSSGIEGRGLIAREVIDEAEVVVRFGGRLVSSDELDALIAAAERDGTYVDTIALFPDRHLVLPAGSDVHFGNHSCDPNLWFVGVDALAARRPIAAGEELTLDYGTVSGGDGFTMRCRCGAASCRGTVTSEDWIRPELVAAYGGHWTPALRARIALRPGGGGRRHPPG